MKKRFRMLALLLSACMMLNLAPMTAYAAEYDVEPISETVEETPEEPETDVVVEPVVETPQTVTPEENIEEVEQTPEEVPVEEELSEEELTEEELTEEQLLGANEETKIFTVDGSGKLQYDGSKPLTGAIDIKAMTEGTVKVIPKNIFAGNTAITSVIIPSTVESFEDGAFSGCTSLSKVAFEENTVAATVFPLELFAGCTELDYSDFASDFKVPAGITEIGKYCFKDCKNITVVDFTDATALTKIEDSAFEGCTSLSTLTSFNTTKVASIGKSAFASTKINQTISVPNTLVAINTRAFANCDKLYSLNLSKVNGASLSIEAGAFEQSAIRSVIFPDDYNTLTAGVFTDCDKMTSVTIGSSTVGKGITKIEAGAFKSCDKLTDIELKESVEEVANNAFENCNNIKKIKSLQGKTLKNGNNMKLYYESFPIISGLNLSGYNGNIEDWVAKHKTEGVTFTSLYTGLKFKINDQTNGNSVSASTSGNAALGVTAKITPKAGSGSTVISVTHGANKAFADYGSNGYTFTITGSDVGEDGEIPINVAFADLANSDTSFKFEVEPTEYVKSKEKADDIEISTLGQSVPLKILALNANYCNEKDPKIYSNPELWSFKSSNASFVSVDSKGKIKALKSTTGMATEYVTITATLKASSKISVKAHVTVKSVQSFGSIASVSFEEAYKIAFGTDASTGLDTAVISKSWLEMATSAKGTRNFNVSVNALDTLGTPTETGFTWKSDNEAIAKVAKKDTVDGGNTIKICGAGETLITATSKEKSASTKKHESISFIVRVVDKTPIVESSSIVINTKSSTGTDFNVISSYGGQISNVAIGTFEKNKWVSKYGKDGGFSIGIASDPVARPDGDFSQALNIGLYTDSSYIGKETTVNNLYVRCLIDNTDYEYIKLPAVKITAKLPAPKVSLAGKVNTFYKANAETKEQTSVVATLGTVAGYDWDTDSQPYIESLDTDTDDIFEDNFDVEPVKAGDYSKLRIFQNVETLKNGTNNKPVLTGNLVIPYKGGIEAKVKITIGTQKVAPTYVLSKTAVTTNKFATGQKFDIQLLDKKTKQPIDLTDEYSFDKYAYNSSAPFTTEIPGFDATNKENDTFTVTIPSGVTSKAKAIVVLRNSNWNTTLTYPLTVNVATANPKIALTSSTVQINKKCDIANSITASFKEDYIDGIPAIEPEKIEPTQKGATLDEAKKIKFEYTNGKLIASIDSDETLQPKNGEYSFKVPYTGKYLGGATFESTATVKVKIVSIIPSMVLSNKGSVKLNNWLLGVTDGENAAEVAKLTYTFNNVPAADSYNVDLTEAELVNMSTKVNGQYPVIAESDSPIAYKFENGTFSIWLKKNLAKNTKFALKNAKVNGTRLADITFTVNAINTLPTITLSPKGTINVLDDNAAVTYTLTIKNFSGTVDPTKLLMVSEYVQDPTNAAASTWKTVIDQGDKTKEMTAHFAFDPASASKNTIKLVVNDRSDLQGKDYKMKVKYVFGQGANSDSNLIEIKTKPVQKMPKVVTSANKMTLYTSNTAYGHSIVVEPAKNETVKIDGIEWSKKNTPETLQKAFAAPQFDKTTGKLTIKIKNAALLKKNKTYTLAYCIKNDNQLTGNNAQGTEFKVTVTVK